MNEVLFLKGEDVTVTADGVTLGGIVSVTCGETTEWEIYGEILTDIPAVRQDGLYRHADHERAALRLAGAVTGERAAGIRRHAGALYRVPRRENPMRDFAREHGELCRHPCIGGKE